MLFERVSWVVFVFDELCIVEVLGIVEVVELD